VVPVNVDTVCIEMIPFCSKLLRGKDVKIKSGVDGACLPSNPTHPTYSDDALRSLFIAYNYVWKWLLWDPHYVTHGSRVDDIIASAIKVNPAFPMVVDVATLSYDILQHHPELEGHRVHPQVHPSFVDRALSSVCFLYLISSRLLIISTAPSTNLKRTHTTAQGI
jgi:hypothetical protein